MYKITLNDGTVIDNLTVNGTNFVSKDKVDESIFTKDNLKKVTINDTVYENLVFIQQMKLADGYYIAFRQKTAEENQKYLIDKQRADIDYIALMSDIDLEEA